MTTVDISFTATDYVRRMERAVDYAASQELDGVLLAPGPDLIYMAGYAPIAITERLTLLILRPEQPHRLLVPVLERPDAEKSPAGSALSLADWRDGDDPYEAAASLLDPAGRYAISDAAWAMHLLGLQRQLRSTSYVSLTDALPMLRAVKDESELSRLEAAASGADEVFGEILRVRFAGRRETEVAADLADGLRRHGHSQVDFTVVGSGPNGANPHHEIGERTIEPGDMVVLDFGGLCQGYGSDMTRMVSVGDPSEEHRRVYEIVKEANEAAFQAVRPGATCQDIDRAARKVITDAGYGEQFLHRTGHGIGLTTHEPPYMVEGEEQPLQPGMCFSIEPGVYLAGKFGVRIEDIVTVTETGGRRLNKATHELQVVA
ncbi:MAG: M24 family metallopeptidase [Tepidiformaceae bacterium]